MTESGGMEARSTLKQVVPVTTTGWEATCEHDDDSGTCIVLDPFNGTGTTGAVAIRHGRSYIGVDVSEQYFALTLERLEAVTPVVRDETHAAAFAAQGKPAQIAMFEEA